MKSRNYYNVLEIERNASQAKIDYSFRTKMLENHHDLNDGYNNNDVFMGLKEIRQELIEAYIVLSNSQKRKQHDSELNLSLMSSAIQAKLTHYSLPPKSSLKISLPVAAIFLDKKLESNRISNVVLHGTKACKLAFTYNLTHIEEFCDSNFTSPMTFGFKKFLPTNTTNSLEFHLYDIAARVYHRPITDNDFRLVSIILLFDNSKSCFEECKNSMSNQTIGKSMVVKLSYEGDLFKMGDPVKLAEFTFEEDIKMEARDPTTAYNICDSMFAEFAMFDMNPDLKTTNTIQRRSFCSVQ